MESCCTENLLFGGLHPRKEHGFQHLCLLCSHGFHAYVCRVEDYWLGYKMFCYAYYSHSFIHESMFRNSKLGILVWQRHSHGPPPTQHAIRTSCMHLLPLVEMYCKWELEEDCSDLRALMHRFDSESELESHELDRSLLFMLRDDEEGLLDSPRHTISVQPGNPFAAVTERLEATRMSILGLHSQVCVLSIVNCSRLLPGVGNVYCELTSFSYSECHSLQGQHGFKILLCTCEIC